MYGDGQFLLLCSSTVVGPKKEDMKLPWFAKDCGVFLEEVLWNDNCSWLLLKQVHYNTDSTYSLFLILCLINFCLIFLSLSY